MDQTIGRRILEIQDRARQDEDTRELLVEYEEAGARLVAVLPELTETQREAVMDYIGVFGALHLMLMELALGRNETKQKRERKIRSL